MYRVPLKFVECLEIRAFRLPDFDNTLKLVKFEFTQTTLWDDVCSAKEVTASSGKQKVCYVGYNIIRGSYKKFLSLELDFRNSSLLSEMFLLQIFKVLLHLRKRSFQNLHCKS